MENTISSRIEFIISELGYNKRSFSAKLGLTNDVTIGRIINEQREPSYKILNRIIQTFGNINANWLLTGQGEIFKDKLSGSQITNTSIQDEPIITFLKEQLKEKDNKIEALSQEIGTLKGEVSKLKEELDASLFKIENIDPSSLFKSPDATSARVPSKKTSKPEKK